MNYNISETINNNIIIILLVHQAPLIHVLHQHPLLQLAQLHWANLDCLVPQILPTKV